MLNQIEDRADVADQLTQVASVSLGSDTLWVVRHYTGAGSQTKMIDTYIIRKQKFLGRFEIQDKPAFDASWQSLDDAELSKLKIAPATEADMKAFRAARMSMLSLVEKIWK